MDGNHVAHGPVETTLKAELFNLATSNYPGDRYAVEEMAAAHGHSILRLSPYHCVFNPIEKIWSILKPKVRERNTQYTATSCWALIEEAASQISPGLWRKECEHVMQEGKKYGDISIIVDNTMDSVVINTSNVYASDTDSSINSESEVNPSS